MYEMTVAAVMTTRVRAVVPETPVLDLVATLAENGIGAVPVIDGRGRPLGVVSEADVLTEQEFAGADESRRDRATRDRWARGHTAAEVMTTPVRAVHADEPVSFVAGVLVRSGVRRLFVIDFDGRLVGVVSRRDLLRVYLRGDAELRAEVADLLAAAGVTADSVDLRVHDGMVTVDGVVAWRGLAMAALESVRALPGVVGVHDNLRYPAAADALMHRV